jgi:hypothetical protein
MDSNITVFTSYKKGLNTIFGNFPVYLNQLNCNVSNAITSAATSNIDLTKIDEAQNTIFLISQESNTYNEFDIVVDIDSLVILPDQPEQILTYNLLA